MCIDCGCQEALSHSHKAHHHHHGEGGGQHPPHPHHHPETGTESRTIRVESNVLAHNDQLAEKNHHWLRERGVITVNLISSPGSGKTALLEKTLEGLKHRIPCAVIVGDLQTDRDAQRLKGKGAPVLQIETINACHLDANHIHQVLPEVVSEDIKLLFIENVGNLVCPAAFDLGESETITLLSVTEGEDKPLKYTVLFRKTTTVIITKTDLMPYLSWDWQQCLDNIRKIRPDCRILALSALTGEGMADWFHYLEQLAGHS